VTNVMEACHATHRLMQECIATQALLNSHGLTRAGCLQLSYPKTVMYQAVLNYHGPITAGCLRLSYQISIVYQGHHINP
jgi:hypothetical protein